MKINEYSTYDGLGLADLVRKNLVTAAELRESADAAIQQVNGDLNFLVARTDDEAQRNLDALPENSAFVGVPTLFKDFGPGMVDVPQELGSGLARGYVPDVDSEITRRWRKAGFVLLGRTTTPEFGSSFTTESRVAGTTRNPWDLQRSSGGSSGGAAAAVAAGVVPIAMGGDSGGSIRIPAHCCGLFGFKPSRGRNPVGPESSEPISGLTANHVLTRSVRDSAAVLDATAGPDLGCKYFCPPPRKSFLQAVNSPLSGLRVAFSTHNCFGGDVDAEVKDATKRAAQLCAEMGYIVEEATPPFDGEQLIDILDVVWTANINHAVQTIATKTGRMPSGDNLEESTIAFANRGAEVTSAELLAGLDSMNKLTRRVAGFFETYDVLITPVFATLAPALGGNQVRAPTLDMRELCRMAFRVGAFTGQFNMTGQPAMSVPLYQSRTGLPIGIQFVARYCEEETLFSLAGQLERALPWAGRRAPISVFEQGHG